MRKKKFLLLLLPVLLFSSLNSCQVNSELRSSQVNSTQKIRLTRNEAATGFTDLDSDGFEDLLGLSRLSLSSDFMVLIYESGCQACSKIKEYMETYVSSTHFVFYGLKNTYYSALYSSLHSQSPASYPSVSGYPTLLGYSSGSCLDVLSGVPSSYAAFQANLDAIISPMSFYSLNTMKNLTGRDDASSTYKYDSFDYSSQTALDAKIASEASLAVLFSWKRCSDCCSLFDDYLIPYMEANPTVSFYGFEVDYFRNRDLSDAAELSLWSAFASKYGFSSYKNGKVPSLVLFKNGVVSSFQVYHNEGSASLNEDGTYSLNEAFDPQIRALTSEKADQKEAEEELKEKAEPIEFGLLKNLYN